MTRFAALLAPALVLAARPAAAADRARPHGALDDRAFFATTANVSGQGGVVFKTKVTLFTDADGAILVNATLRTADGPVDTKPITIERTKTFSNFLQDVFGRTGAGSVELVAAGDDSFVATAEVYVDVAGGGRYKMAIAPASADDEIVPGFVGVVSGVSVNASTRLNAGCANKSSSPVSARVTVLDAASAPVGTPIDFGLAAQGWGQVPVNVGSFENGFLVIQASGTVACYATEIDNPTADATFFLATPMLFP